MAIPINTSTFINQNTQYGALPYEFIMANANSATTAATVNCGSTTMQRINTPFTMPSSFGTGVTGGILTQCHMMTNLVNCTMMACLEYNLGSINLATGTFTDGSTMPTKLVAGSSVQTASFIPVMVVNATLTATTPTITVTYKNQAGTNSRSAALVLPTNTAINSAFNIAPHLQGTDTGIQDVTNITKSAGTSGTITVYGLLPLAIATFGNAQSIISNFDPMTVPLYPYRCEASENIAFYSMGVTTTLASVAASLNFIADN